MTDERGPVGDDDRRHLARAIALGRAGMEQREGGPFGAVVVVDDIVVAEGWNRVTSTLDPTAHAEVVALRRATARSGHFELPGATVYASGEPCPMCWAACRWARVARIVYANDRAMAADIGFDDQFLYDELDRPTRDHDVPLVHLPMEAGRELYEAWAADPSLTRY
ncbi:nucleoside deaminase [Salsipaludibacter albus]|uniref:nucleoside deaminase n=1 Tax=Salsipaludibacter albus TaxID=2849650 RepID=UPI001EE4157A